MSESRKALARAIHITSVYYGRELHAEVLSMMCDDLADLDVDKCIDAYARWRRNPQNRTFPLPAQIRELVNPEEFVSVETQAREIAARICAAVPKFGWNNAKEAQVFIGAVGWSVVQRQGGWGYICENLGRALKPSIFQAQLRDQVEGTLRFGDAAVEKAIGVSANKGHMEIESAAKILNLLNESIADNE